MEERSFKFSEDTIKERRKRIYVMMGMMPVIFSLFYYIFARQNGIADFGIMIGIFVFVLVFMICETLIVTSTMLKKLRQMQLIMGSEAFERRGGKFAELVNYSDINFLEVRRGNKGQIIFIKVKYLNKIINISGFEEMETILKQLTESMPEGQPVKEKQYKINWENPVILIFIMLLTVIVILVIISAGANYYGLFNLLFILAFGLFFLLYKPISRNAGKRFRTFEIIISVIMLIVAFLALLGLLLTH